MLAFRSSQPSLSRFQHRLSRDRTGAAAAFSIRWADLAPIIRPGAASDNPLAARDVCPRSQAPPPPPPRHPRPTRPWLASLRTPALAESRRLTFLPRPLIITRAPRG